MTTFDQREEAFERKYAHDEELIFKAHARRDAKLGRWAAGLLGKSGAEAEAYADSIIGIRLGSGDTNALVARLVEDFAAAGVVRSEHQIRRQMDEFMVEAQHEVRTA